MKIRSIIENKDMALFGSFKIFIQANQIDKQTRWYIINFPNLEFPTLLENNLMEIISIRVVLVCT